MPPVLYERARCPACLHPEHSVLHREPYDGPRLRAALVDAYADRGTCAPGRLAGETYELRACAACGLRFQAFAPEPGFAAELYGTWNDADRLCATREQTRPMRYFDAVNATAQELMYRSARPPRRTRVLDFGMGWGDLCLALMAFGAEVDGLELSPDKVDRACRRGIRAVPEVAPGQYDIVCATQVLEHVDDPVAVLRAMRGALRPGGFAYVAVPDGAPLHALAPDRVGAAVAGPLAKLAAPLEHLNVFTAETLARAARTAGLSPDPRASALPRARQTLGRVKLRALRRVGLCKDSSVHAYFRATAETDRDHETDGPP